MVFLKSLPVDIFPFPSPWKNKPEMKNRVLLLVDWLIVSVFVGGKGTTTLLKAVVTIGNCQRLAFTDGVSQHMHKITNL